jgi:hypothetical protein
MDFRFTRVLLCAKGELGYAASVYCFLRKDIIGGMVLPVHGEFLNYGTSGICRTALRLALGPVLASIFVERLIGKIRREYHDHVLFWNLLDAKTRVIKSVLQRPPGVPLAQRHHANALVLRAATHSRCYRSIPVAPVLQRTLLHANGRLTTNPPPTGGTNDNLARVNGQRLTETLGQAVVVDNRPAQAAI